MGIGVWYRIYSLILDFFLNMAGGGGGGEMPGVHSCAGEHAVLPRTDHDSLQILMHSWSVTQNGPRRPRLETTKGRGGVALRIHQTCRALKFIVIPSGLDSALPVGSL
jgi:hypothetical protein